MAAGIAKPMMNITVAYTRLFQGILRTDGMVKDEREANRPATSHADIIIAR